MELGCESGTVHTLADYIRQNLHGGLSLDILGLRSLNPTPANIDTATDSVAFELKPNSGDSGGETPATSAAGAERKTRSHGLDQEPEEKIKPCAQRSPGVVVSAQQNIGRLVHRNTEIPSPGKKCNPIHVGNLQTKKVASTPRLKFWDMISDESKDVNRDKRRLPSETHAIFSQDGKASIEENMLDQGALQSQERFHTSDSVADWGGANPLNLSLQPKNSLNSRSHTLVSGSSNPLSKFLPTLTLKSSPPLNRDKKAIDCRFRADSFQSSLRDTRNGTHDVYFSDPTFNTTDVQAEVSRKLNFSKSLLDIEYFHVMQEAQRFDISDSIGFTKKNQVMQDREGYGVLNSSFRIQDHEETHDYPFLRDLSFERGYNNFFESDSNISKQGKNGFSPRSDSITWNNNNLSAPLNSKRKFRNLDHFWSIQVPSSHRSQYCSRRFGTYDAFQDMVEDFYPSLDYREISDVKIDKFLLPMDDFEVESRHADKGYSSRDDVSSRPWRTNKRNFDEGTLDQDDDRSNTSAFSENWECDLSATLDIPRLQENIDTAHSGGNSDRDSDQTHILHGSNSWSQTVDGGTADQYPHCLESDTDVMQEKFIPSEKQETIARETFQNLKPLLESPINNSGDDDFILVCFSDNEECPTVDVNSFQPTIQPTSLPLLKLGSEKSSLGVDHDTDVLSYGTQFKRISQESDDFRVSGKVITAAEATSSAHTKLISARGSLTRERILTSQRSELDYSLLPYSASSFGKGTEVMALHLRGCHREASSELYSFPKTRKSFSKFLAKDKQAIGSDLEVPTFCNDNIDHCLSSNILSNRASGYEVTHSIKKTSVEACTSTREPQLKEMNGVSTMGADRLPRKQLGIEDGVANDTAFRASISSQEECSPASQLNTVQAVICKLQRPAFSDRGINVDNVLLKFQRPKKRYIHGLGHQDAEAYRTMKQISDSNTESEIKPTECRTRLLTYNKASGSRGGSFPLPYGSKTICLSSKGDEAKRGASEISTLRKKESKLSLDDIDAIDSTDDRFSNQSHQRIRQSSAHSIPSIQRIKEMADSSAPRAGDAKKCPTPVSQRHSISEVPDRAQPYCRDPDPQVSDTGRRDSSTNTPRASGGKGITKTSEVQEELQNIQHNLRITEKRFQIDGSPTSPYDAAFVKVTERFEPDQHNLHASGKQCQQDNGPSTPSKDAVYVKMLESYVVQLKLENTTLRLWAAGL